MRILHNGTLINVFYSSSIKLPIDVIYELLHDLVDLDLNALAWCATHHELADHCAVIRSQRSFLVIEL